jgi:YidC/Oxa1 family membrane protein insertase
MDRNSITGIVLIGLILIIFSVLNRPSQEEIDAARRRQDSLEIVRQKQISEEARQITREDISQDAPLAEPDTEQEMDRLQNRYGDFALAATGTDEMYVVENEKIRVSISAKGGRPWSVRLKEFQTWDSLPLILFEGDGNSFGLNFFAQNRSISTNDLFFHACSCPSGQDSQETGPHLLRLYAGEDSVYRICL